MKDKVFGIDKQKEDEIISRITEKVVSIFSQKSLKPARPSANNPFNSYSDGGVLQSSDLFLISRAPHSGATTFKTTLNSVLASVAGGLNLQGSWDASGGSVPSLTPSQGDFWIISVAGTILGVSYSVGDWIAWNGSAWFRVLNSNPDLSTKTVKYVSSDGSDTTGTGSVLNPWATVSHAMSQITTNSSTSPFVISISGYINDSGTINYKPWVGLKGETVLATLNNSNPIVPDNSWQSNVNGNAEIQDLTINGDMTLDFSAMTFASAGSPNIGFNNVGIFGTFSLAGAVNCQPVLFTYDNYIPTAYFDNASIISYAGDEFDNISFGTLKPAVSGDGLGCQITAAQLGNVTFSPPSALTYTPGFQIKSSIIQGTLSGNGSNCNIVIDPDSYVTPTLTDDATITLLSAGVSVCPVGGDLSGEVGSAAVATVGGATAANIASGISVVNAATSLNTANTLVLRGVGGNFSAGTITASLNGNASTATSATSATSVTGSFAGDVTGTQSAMSVSLVGGVTASNVASGANIANAATSSNTANTIMKRDGSGDFSATVGNFSGGTGAVAISGSNGALTIGSPCTVGLGSNSGAFFSNATTGDMCIRNTNAGNSIYLGIGSTAWGFAVRASTVVSAYPFYLPTTGGTASGMSYYESNSFATLLSGAATISSYTITVTRRDNDVTLYLPTWSETATASANQTNGSLIPARWCPASTVKKVCSGMNGGTIQAITVEVDPSGLITWYGSTAQTSFTDLTAIGFDGDSITYQV